MFLLLGFKYIQNLTQRKLNTEKYSYPDIQHACFPHLSYGKWRILYRQTGCYVIDKESYNTLVTLDFSTAQSHNSLSLTSIDDKNTYISSLHAIFIAVFECVALPSCPFFSNPTCLNLPECICCCYSVTCRLLPCFLPCCSFQLHLLCFFIGT